MTLRAAILRLGMERRFRRALDRLDLPAGPLDPRPVRDAEVADLPDPAERYLRFMRVVGRPRDRSFRARFVGQFRLRPGQAFLRCEAWQYNSVLPATRVYYMRIDLAGLVPMFGTDTT